MGLTPLMIDLADKEIVIAGGGRVAEEESVACWKAGHVLR